MTFWLTLCYYPHGLVIYLNFYLKKISFMYGNEANHHSSWSHLWSSYFMTQIANSQIYGPLRHISFMFREHCFVCCQQHSYYSGVWGTGIFESLLRCPLLISRMHLSIYSFIFFIYLGVFQIVGWITLDRCVHHVLCKKPMANQKTDCWYNI